MEKLKLRPTISQVGTYTYNAAKVIADYLKPLCQNEYKINDTFFPLSPPPLTTEYVKSTPFFTINNSSACDFTLYIQHAFHLFLNHCCYLQNIFNVKFSAGF